MGMGEHHIVDLDPDEVRASANIVGLLKYVASLSSKLDPYQPPEPGSPLAADRERCPRMEVGATAHQMLVSAHGSLQALQRSMNIKQVNGEYILEGHLHGIYDLIRNALETAAAALWLTSPVHSMQRVRRVLILLRQDNIERERFFVTAGIADADFQEEHREAEARLDDYAADAGLTEWRKANGKYNYKKYGAPLSSQMLRSADWNNPRRGRKMLSWESAWRACSGSAHGKGWALTLLNSSEQLQPDSADRSDLVSIRYVAVATMLYSATTLLTTALNHYLRAGQSGTFGRVMPVPVPNQYLIGELPET